MPISAASSTNLLVWGTPINHVTHHTGKITKPIKNNQAHRGLPPLSAQLVPSHLLWPLSTLEGNDSDQGVLCIGAGFLGSCMWNLPEYVTEGAWGEIRADIGRDIWERLGREGTAIWYW